MKTRLKHRRVWEGVGQVLKLRGERIDSRKRYEGQTTVVTVQLTPSLVEV